jgi:hypothetical protein
MHTAASRTATDGLLEAIVARDFLRAVGNLAPDVDFRAMTPNRIWEARDPAAVEEILRTWFADPDEEIASIEPTRTEAVEDTVRIGWRVRGSDAEGSFVFEQLAYVRESEGKVTWLRAICSGPRPT